MSKKKNHDVVHSLQVLLADSYTLYLKTQNYHWNVTGAQFSALHAFFQSQYEELATVVDDVAERLRALDEKAPGSFSAFAKLATIKEETGTPDAKQMLKNLAADHETAADTAQKLLKAAQEIGDEATADLAIGRIQSHQKQQWMIKAHLE